MYGRLVAGLIVVGLAIGVWALWPSVSGTTSNSVAEAVSTTSTTAPPPSSTTIALVTTATSPSADVIETVAEAEAILTELWFGWFEGIYNQDEERIKEVVASQSQFDAAKAAFGAGFTSPPTLTGIQLAATQILRTDIECLVTYSEIDVSAFRGPGAATSSVEVLRFASGKWRFVASWSNPNDLWEQDCDSQLEPLS